MSAQTTRTQPVVNTQLDEPTAIPKHKPTPGGGKIVQIVPMLSNLSTAERRIPLKTNVLTTDTGSVFYGCRECPGVLDYVADTVADVRAHRAAKHGFNLGAVQAQLVARQREPEESTQDILAGERPDEDPAEPKPASNVVKGGALAALAQTPPVEAKKVPKQTSLTVPPSLAAMSFGEVLRFAGETDRLGQLISSLRAENGELTRELRDKERRLAEATAALDRYRTGLRALAGLTTEEEE